MNGPVCGDGQGRYKHMMARHLSCEVLGRPRAMLLSLEEASKDEGTA